MPKVKFCTIGLYDKEDNLLSMDLVLFLTNLNKECLLLRMLETL